LTILFTLILISKTWQIWQPIFLLVRQTDKWLLQFCIVLAAVVVSGSVFCSEAQVQLVQVETATLSASMLPLGQDSNAQ